MVSCTTPVAGPRDLDDAHGRDGDRSTRSGPNRTRRGRPRPAPPLLVRSEADADSLPTSRCRTSARRTAIDLGPDARLVPPRRRRPDDPASAPRASSGRAGHPTDRPPTASTGRAASADRAPGDRAPSGPDGRRGTMTGADRAGAGDPRRPPAGHRCPPTATSCVRTGASGDLYRRPAADDPRAADHLRRGQAAVGPAVPRARRAGARSRSRACCCRRAPNAWPGARRGGSTRSASRPSGPGPLTEVARIADRLWDWVALPPRRAGRRCSAWSGASGRGRSARCSGRSAATTTPSPVGDYHIPNLVAFNLAGEPRGRRRPYARAPRTVPRRARSGASGCWAGPGGTPPAFGPRRRILPCTDGDDHASLRHPDRCPVTRCRSGEPAAVDRRSSRPWRAARRRPARQRQRARRDGHDMTHRAVPGHPDARAGRGAAPWPSASPPSSSPGCACWPAPACAPRQVTVDAHDNLEPRARQPVGPGHRGVHAVGRPLVHGDRPQRLPDVDPAEHHLLPARGPRRVLPAVPDGRPGLRPDPPRRRHARRARHQRAARRRRDDRRRRTSPAGSTTTTSPSGRWSCSPSSPGRSCCRTPTPRRC